LDGFLQDAGGIDEIDSELRSSEVPFDGLSDLFRALGFANDQPPQKATLTVSAGNLLVVDRARSTVIGGKAKIFCRMSPGLDRELVRIGVRPWDSAHDGRTSASGEQIIWHEDAGVLIGEVEINTGDNPAALVLLSHSGALFDRWWVSDSEKHISPAYAAHQAVDKESAELGRFLSGLSKSPAADFETGVAILLGLFRFSVVHYGLTPTLRDSPDLLAFTEKNQLLVIECTTGTPNENNKISKLVVRTEKIRESLRVSGNAHVDALPVIVTTTPRAVAQEDVASAARNGVVVAVKEDVDALFERIRIPPSASELFDAAKARISTP
jgi:hypothetical protein